MKFAKSHEWIEVTDDLLGTVGISDFAKKELGDVVYIDLPEVGKKVEAGYVVCIIESTKAATDIYSPVSGTIQAVNADFIQNQTWIYKIKLSAPNEMTHLLSLEEYERSIS